MSANPVSRIRLFGSIAIVATTLVALAAASLSIGPSGFVWAGIIGAVALGYAIMSFVIHLRHPVAADAAGTNKIQLHIATA